MRNKIKRKVTLARKTLTNQGLSNDKHGNILQAWRLMNTDDKNNM